jgi:succinylarginine dihydrolase
MIRLREAVANHGGATTVRIRQVVAVVRLEAIDPRT